MNDAQTSAGRVLWVGADAPAGPLAGRVALVVERDPEVATARVASEPFDGVVVDGADPEAVSVVLGAAASNPRIGRRMVASTYEGVPELVRVVEVGLIQRVLAKPVSGPQLVHAVIDADPSASVIYRRALNAPSDLGVRAVDERLRELVARIVDVPAVAIRPLAPTDLVPRLQLVVPIADPLQDLRRELPAMLGWPLKAHGSAMGRDYRGHPLRRVLGNLSESQEVYCLGRERFAYVAFFPWADDLKVTVVIGFEQPDPDRVAALHRHAVGHACEFPLPTRHRHSPDIFYDPDYDWVITRNYVGPDRRRKGTSFINRYTFRGRRAALMPGELSSAGTFVDTAPRWTWIAAGVFAALFLFDTAMTVHWVGNGDVGELNPAMRWALGHSPALLWLLKSALAVAVSFVVLRWHPWRPGRWLFAASVAIYAVLDVYWVALVLTERVG